MIYYTVQRHSESHYYAKIENIPYIAETGMLTKFNAVVLCHPMMVIINFAPRKSNIAYTCHSHI